MNKWFTFKVKTVPLCLYLGLMTLLISLGIWQLNRADEKRQLLALQAQQQSAGTIPLKENNLDHAEAILYQKTKVSGRYDNKHQFFLDNQVVEGKAGYYVLTPLLIEGTDKAVLVNRGWVPLGNSRLEQPELTVHQNNRIVSGRINRFPRPGIVLEGAEIPSESWPAIIQVVDTELLAKRLGYRLFGFQIELDQELEDGFIRRWHDATTLPPEKHVAYAVQWFLLALTLSVLFFKYGFERKQ